MEYSSRERLTPLDAETRARISLIIFVAIAFAVVDIPFGIHWLTFESDRSELREPLLVLNQYALFATLLSVPLVLCAFTFFTAWSEWRRLLLGIALFAIQLAFLAILFESLRQTEIIKFGKYPPLLFEYGYLLLLSYCFNALLCVLLRVCFGLSISSKTHAPEPIAPQPVKRGQWSLATMIEIMTIVAVNCSAFRISQLSNFELSQVMLMIAALYSATNIVPLLWLLSRRRPSWAQWRWLILIYVFLGTCLPSWASAFEL